MSIITDLSVNKKWEGRKGDDNNFTITFVDAAAAAFDLTGYVFSLQIYTSTNKSTPQLALTEGSGITNGDDSGIVTFRVTDTQSDALRADSYFYQIKAVFPDANTHILFQGEFELVEFQSNNSVSSGVTATLNLNGSNVTATITVAGGGGTTTASNGLTKTGDDIALGGTVTTDIEIITDGLSSKLMKIQSADFVTTFNDEILFNFEDEATQFLIDGLNLLVVDLKPTKTGIKNVASGYVTDPLSLTTKEWVEALFAVPVKFPSYTVATLPTATAAQQIYVSDETGGAVMAFSDGTNWRRCTDRVIVS